MRTKGISDEKTDSQVAYLFMSSPITTPQQTPITTNRPGEHHFDFNFAPTHPKVEEAEVNSVELGPILHSHGHESREQTTPEKLAEACSNPEYQNYPAISYSGSSPAEHYPIPLSHKPCRMLSLNCDPIYANVADHLKEEVEPVYAVPTNNAEVA